MENNTDSICSAVTVAAITPCASWQQLHIGCTNCPQAAMTEKPVGDNLLNLMKYALGLDPLTACANPMQPDQATTNGFTYLRLTTPRASTMTGVLIEGLSTGTLTDTNGWSTGTTVIESNTPSWPQPAHSPGIPGILHQVKARVRTSRPVCFQRFWIRVSFRRGNPGGF